MSLVGIIGQMKDLAYNSLLLLQSANQPDSMLFRGNSSEQSFMSWTVAETAVGFLEWHVNPIKAFSAMLLYTRNFFIRS